MRKLACGIGIAICMAGSIVSFGGKAAPAQSPNASPMPLPTSAFASCLWKSAAHHNADLQAMAGPCGSIYSYCPREPGQDQSICLLSLAILEGDILDGWRGGLRGFPKLSSSSASDVEGNPNLDYEACLRQAYAGDPAVWYDATRSCSDQYQQFIEYCIERLSQSRGQCETFFAAEAIRYKEQ